MDGSYPLFAFAGQSALAPHLRPTGKFIVDIAGSLPTIIAEYSDPNSFTNSYIYADAQILAQYTYDSEEEINEKFYYVHDRLGSVRLMVDYDDSTDTVGAVNTYTYNPFGDHYTPDVTGTDYNPFQFTGQWYDEEIDQYYLRARMYDPTMMRFTTRDPLAGKYKEPLTLHRYLYCGNDSINRIDPEGEIFSIVGVLAGVIIHDAFQRTEYARVANIFAFSVSAIGMIYDIAYFGPPVYDFVTGVTSEGGALEGWVDRFKKWWEF